MVALKLKEGEEPTSSGSYENSEFVTYAEARKPTIRNLISLQLLHPVVLMEKCLYLVMVEIQVIQHHEDEGQPQVIVIMVRWSLAVVIVFFKGLYSVTRYGISLLSHFRIYHTS